MQPRQPTIINATNATTRKGFRGGSPVGMGDDVPGGGQRAFTEGAVSPKAAGTCWRKMIAAMPSVKPSITGQGMNVTARPRPVTPAANTSRPASTVTERDAAEAVLGDDRGEHHGHRAGGPGHLDVRAAEHRGDQTGDDRGDQSGRGADARADSERQRQGERDDTHGDAGQNVAPPGAGKLGVVAATGQKPGELAGRGGRHLGLPNRRERLEGFQLITLRAKGIGEKDAGDDQQLGDLRMCQLVEHRVADPVVGSRRGDA